MIKNQQPGVGKVLPSPESIQLSVNVDVINAMAIRRGKVRELMRMGYSIPAMQKILNKGIKLPDDSILDVDVSEDVIKNDIAYIRQEMAAESSEDVIEKRAEILDKLSFLYERAMSDYVSTKGVGRNSFLNTALAIMTKIVEIEGVRSPEKLDTNLAGTRKVSNLAEELNKLEKDDKQRIITTLREITHGSDKKRDRGTDLPDGAPRVSTQTSDDEGVSGES